MWLELWSVITIIVCLVGAYLALKRIQFLSGSDEVVTKRIVHIFYTDFGIYLVTAFLGVFTFVNINADFLLYPVRALLLCSNIYFAWRLISPLKE